MAAITEYANSGDAAKAEAGKGILLKGLHWARQVERQVGPCFIMPEPVSREASLQVLLEVGPPGQLPEELKDSRKPERLKVPWQGAGEGALKGGAMGGILRRLTGSDALWARLSRWEIIPKGFQPDGLLVRTRGSENLFGRYEKSLTWKNITPSRFP